MRNKVYFVRVRCALLSSSSIVLDSERPESQADENENENENVRFGFERRNGLFSVLSTIFDCPRRCVTAHL